MTTDAAKTPGQIAYEAYWRGYGKATAWDRAESATRSKFESVADAVLAQTGLTIWIDRPNKPGWWLYQMRDPALSIKYDTDWIHADDLNDDEHQEMFAARLWRFISE
jgi:hypothetical protein